MASPPNAAVPRLGRGRGGGIRLTSYSPMYDLSYFATKTISHSTAAYKSFFAQRKKSSKSRHNLNKSVLRSLQYKSLVQLKFSSQPSFTSSEETFESVTMPSPTFSVPATPQPSTTTTWTPVTHGAKQDVPPPHTQPVVTNNSFEALSDDDHDSPASAEFGSSEDTDMDGDNTTKRKSKTNRKKKHSSKKTKTRRKKHYVKFVDSDSDENLPPRPSNKDKLTSTQKQLFSDDSDPINDESSPDPTPDELVDSDKESTALKNADIRNFMTSQKNIETSQTTQITSPSLPHNEEASPTPVTPGTTATPSPDPVPPPSTQLCRKIIERTSVLNPTTPLSTINEFTRYEMVSMLFQWNPTDKKDDHYMLDEPINSLRTHIYELQKNMDDISHEIRVTTKHQEDTQTREMKYRLQGPTSPSSTTPDNANPVLQYDNTNSGGLSAVPESSDAETLGMNINMMMARPIGHNPLRPPPVTNESTSPPVSLTQFTARFDISTKKTSAINVPLIARQLFRIFKKADRTLRLLPWFPDEQNDVAAIDQESDIPTPESHIKQWIDNPRLVNSRLLFAMRVECIVSLKHIRDTFVPWMLKNDSRLKLDTLAAKEIYGLGFIADVHPRLYNRAKMKQFLHQQLKKQNHDVELNVYSRNVWGVKNKQRLACQAIVIEVDKKYRDSAMSALMELQFAPQYRFAKYIPFDKTIVPDDLLYDILLSNNEYQSATRRKIITGLSDLTIEHSTLTESTFTIRDWLLSIKNPQNEDYIFEHVESSQDDIAVIYSSTYDETVKDFLNHITEHIRSTFTHPNDILSTTKSLNTRTNSRSDASKAYNKKLTSIFASNPQDPPSAPPKTPPKTKTLYYGAADSVQKTYLNHLTQPAQTLPPAVTPPSSQAPKPSPSKSPPDSVQQQIMHRLSKLERANEDTNTKIDSKFKEMEEKREAAQAKMISSVTEVVTNSMATTLPQLIAAQLKVAFQQEEGEDL